MTFNAFVQQILNNTLPFDVHNNIMSLQLRETDYLNWISNNAQHLKNYSTADFLEIYMEYYDVQENEALSDYDDAIETKAEYMDQVVMEKWLDIDDMVKDTETFGYSDFMFNMSYDVW